MARKGRRRGSWGLLWAAILVLVLGAAAAKMYKELDFGNRAGEAPDVPLRVSAWMADWDWQSGLKDLEQAAGGLDSLQSFAIYFDAADRLYVTKTFQEGLVPVMEGATRYGLSGVGLTFVNDVWQADGTTVQKDPKLIERLTASKESRGKHIEEILAAVDTYGAREVEIDYERIDENDWPGVMDFYSELYERLKERGIQLRVVLEPRAPIGKLPFPEGPSYVMMAYNLYGTHSGPGPKADLGFVGKMAERVRLLKGEGVVALSAGGFDWSDDGQAVGITERQAAELLQKSGKAPTRDSASGSLYFDYEDQEGRKHTVWYADERTLSGWIDAVRAAGIHHVAIWRLNGLSEATLQMLRERGRP